MEFEHPYLNKYIIAYIGNKRRLLKLIHKAIISLMKEIKPGLKFFDAFSGSGVVSRFGKYLNFEVYSNDWEYYSFIFNKGFVETSYKDIKVEFGSIEKFKLYIEKLNNLPDPLIENQYIAKYYAPKSKDINNVDYKKERLFYTRDNALIIDKIRNKIEEDYPKGKNDKIRNLLISILLYKAATHTNTSGVFKAFHKGFGGHGKDALKRILNPIRLELPPLINSEYPVYVYQNDTNELVKSKKIRDFDLAYLDPPYNQHQYGSNYHMLNTIAIWDKIPAPLQLDDNGVLRDKAAIRKDWKKTKSDYCYRDKAVHAFADLLNNIDSKYILISYSTDGIIPFEDMREMCMKKGKVGIVTSEYTKYRGGKQSNHRANTNIEFVLTIDTEKETNSEDILVIDKVIKSKKLNILLKQKFSPVKLQKHADNFENDLATFILESNEIHMKIIDGYKLENMNNIDYLTDNDLSILYNKIYKCICNTKVEELESILSILKKNNVNRKYYLNKVPDILKKLAHKKNKEIFYEWLSKIKTTDFKGYEKISKKISDIEELALKRFEN